MNRMAVRMASFLAIGLGTAGTLLGESPGTSGGAIDLGAIRAKASPCVCRVTVQNSWGVPLAYANGFLLGQGRFVITDLGAVAQPGVAQATLQFAEGPAVVAKQFGLAEPTIGLAALLVEGESPPRPGLDLIAEMPSLEGGTMVATTGWRWCKEQDAVAGRLGRGPAAREVAQRCGVEAPEAADVFLRLDGARLDAASGAPILDRQGAVLAVKIDLAAKDVAIPLAVPASSFRKTLLSAQPQLKPLTDMPKLLWPVRLLRIPGEPQTQQEFAKTVQALKAGMVCQRCEGTGTVKGEGGRRGLRWPFGDGRPGVCPDCQGTKIAFRPAVYPLYSAMVLEATRVVWSPATDERTRAAVHGMATEMVKHLTQANLPFQVGVAFAGWTDVANARKALPRGVILYCEVSETVDGPDGKYVLVGPYNSPPSVAVRADLLAGSGGKGPAAGRKLPEPGDRIVLAGSTMGPFKSPAQQGVYVLPFEWTTAPGELPELRPPGRPPGPPDRPPGAPDRPPERGQR